MTNMLPYTKHIDIPCHSFCTKMVELGIAIIGVSTTGQLADQFSKGLTEEMFRKTRKKLTEW